MAEKIGPEPELAKSRQVFHRHPGVNDSPLATYVRLIEWVTPEGAKFYTSITHSKIDTRAKYAESDIKVVTQAAIEYFQQKKVFEGLDSKTQLYIRNNWLTHKKEEVVNGYKGSDFSALFSQERQKMEFESALILSDDKFTFPTQSDKAL